jgi:hypothetical protein
MNEAEIVVDQVENRLRILEVLVSEHIEDMRQRDAGWREWSDAAMELIVSRLDEISGRVRLDDDMLREWATWRVGHEEACRGIVAWIESLELDRHAELMRREGQVQKFLTWIWRADEELRPKNPVGGDA